MTLHPTVANPYTLLSLLLPRTKVYTCLDLKDAFFCICLAPASQPIFAFEWEDPVGSTKQQLIWTPPQGFKNFPAIFGKALAFDLDSFHPEEYGCRLLQYGDDLLLAASDQGKMLEMDKCTAPAVDGSRLPGVEEEGTDLQRGRKVSGVCFKEGLKVPDPNLVLYTGGTSLIKQGQWLSG